MLQNMDVSTPQHINHRLKNLVYVKYSFVVVFFS